MQSVSARTRRTYDLTKISVLLDKVLADIGPDRFSQMKLLEAEKLIRRYDVNHELPGKTLLREAIHRYRSAKWPACAPKRLDHFRRF